MNKKSLPIVVAVAVVALILLIVSITRSMRTGTSLPMPAKPKLQDEAMRHIMMRGNPAAGAGAQTGMPAPAAGGAASGQ